MKVSQLLIKTDKNAPADCTAESQKLMVRGGYIKYVHSGVYSLTHITKRITSKIEAIIRQEMDRIDGQEVLFPVVMNSNIWEESGRYFTIGSELVRFKDRKGNNLVLGMTHEEAAVHMARNIANSYTQYPFMIYQIQTKFRDEPAPKSGLIRVREFTMKDAYSFHTSQEDLEAYYERALEAYNRIFKRAGAKNFVAVKSDSGMMGGSISHEFMLISDIGEDTIAICEDCDYRANVEVAKVTVENTADETLYDANKIHTPHVTTIDSLVKKLKIGKDKLIKAVVYQRNKDDSYVIAFVRGDYEINETKLRNVVQDEIHPAVITEESGIVEGFIGPIGLDKEKYTVVYDGTIKGATNMVCGANEKDYHLRGVSVARDIGDVEFVDVAKIKDGDVCPCCGKKKIMVRHSIEIGNIFQLGTKYSKSMNMTYLDQNGEAKNPIMGCYGIGVGRLAASICEESHDAYGPVWPMSIAPWQVEICAVRSDVPEVKALADSVYDSLQKLGIETLYDDRDLRPGAMFADADLFGIPVRAVISPKNLEQNEVEILYRDHSVKEFVPVEETVERIKNHVETLMAQYKI